MPQSIRETGSGAAFTVGGQLVPQPVRWRTFAGSLGLHLLAVLTALALDRSTAGEPYSPPTVAEAAAAEGLKITWYRPEELLPAVAPAAAVDGPPRPEAQDRFKLKQRIEAASPEADSLRQMIVNGPPEIRIERDIETANMLSLAPIVERQRFELRSPAEGSAQASCAARARCPANRRSGGLRRVGRDAGTRTPALSTRRGRATGTGARSSRSRSGRPTSSPRLRLQGWRRWASLRLCATNPAQQRTPAPERQAVAAAPPDVQAQAVQGVDLTAFSADAAITLHGRRVSGRGAVPRGAARCLGGSADLGRGGARG